jgi:Tol biopolymer transport system component
MLAFVATDSLGKNRLWVRPLQSLIAVSLEGTNGAQYPFWSYDNKSIAFFARGKLMRVDAVGGPVTTICDAANGRGGAWNRFGTILFSPGSNGPLYQVPAAGGVPSPLTKLDTLNTESSHRWPFFFPDGKHFVYTTYHYGSSATGSLFVSSTEDSARKKILEVPSNAEFAGGYLLYVLQNNLIARPFDPGTLEFAGDPAPIAEKVVYDPSKNRSSFSVSQNGVLVYQSGNSKPPALCLVDRNGTITSDLKIGPVAFGARFSSDGKKIVFDREDVVGKNNDIWIYEIARNISTRLTFDQRADLFSIFSPNGNKVLYTSARIGNADIYMKDVNGMGKEEMFFSDPWEKFITSWSSDGLLLIVMVRKNSSEKWDMAYISMQGEKKLVPLEQTEFNDMNGQFSPDARWIAYVSDESGKNEVYVRTLDPRGGKWQVSTAGGDNVRWVRRTNELIYVTADKKVVSATVKYSGNAFEVVRTTPLFDLNINGVGRPFDVSEDGKTFLIQFTGMEGASLPATLVMNWDEELRKK